MIPNWHTTASNNWSPNGKLHASVCSHCTASSLRNFAAARRNIGSFKSVAISSAVEGRRVRRTRVKMPVPHANSKTESFFATCKRDLNELRLDRKSVLPLLKKISDGRGQSLLQ